MEADDAIACCALARRFLVEVCPTRPDSLVDWLHALVGARLLAAPARAVVVREDHTSCVVLRVDGADPAPDAEVGRIVARARRRVDAALQEARNGERAYVADALFARRVAREPRGDGLRWRPHLHHDDALSDWVLALAAVGALSGVPGACPGCGAPSHGPCP